MVAGDHFYPKARPVADFFKKNFVVVNKCLNIGELHRIILSSESEQKSFYMQVSCYVKTLGMRRPRPASALVFLFILPQLSLSA